MVPDWLSRYAPGYTNLSSSEKDAISHFALLWSLFEAQVLNTSASANSIVTKVDEWHGAQLLILEDFERYRSYFIHRYIESGATNNGFTHLHLRHNDKPELVESVLKNQDNTITSVVAALLIIVLRYRNNCFHGIKWAYEFRDQLENFTTANNLLMKVLEINTHE